VVNVKSVTRYLAQRTVLRPSYVRYCSQTIYEALLGCCRMWEATKSALWKDRAEHVLEILARIQQSDGGFDIGYDFNFGRFHKKGQATSPELVGLVALSEYARLFAKKQAEHPARHAAEWIRERALDMGEGKVAIPYSPYTIKEVMVYNGTSFACGALGCYLGQFSGDEELRRIYSSMIRYLEAVLSKDQNLPGRFWYYCDQTRNDLDELKRTKIDYYHQMQQVEVHSLAQQRCPLEMHLKIIRNAADHVVALNECHPIVPYTNDSRFFKNQIHLWGLSSVVAGMLEASVVLPKRAEIYRGVARDVLDWILKYGWNGEHFEAILNNDGSPVEHRAYMVRSDAWVFNALSAASKHFRDVQWNNIAEKCYQKMESVDFSGPESHASTPRRRLFVFLWKALKKFCNPAK
jgi:hypothetical protein